jgi:hypothetical protein
VKRLLWVFAALLPVIGEWLYKFAIHPRPFWIHYYDPETSYFYEGLRILSGVTPWNIDNPGTTVQLASAAIALVTGDSPLAYPHFLPIAHIVGLAVTIAGALVLGRTLLRDVSPPLVVVALWTWFMAPQVLEYQMIWTAEVFFFGLGTLALATIVSSLRAHSLLRDALAGITIGVLIATKFVFLAWLPALMMAYLVARERPFTRSTAALLGAIGGFVAVTAVAISRYPAMVRWLTGLAANSGTYGGGKRELPRVSDVLANYWHAMSTAKAWLLWLAVVAVCAILAFRRAPRLRPAIVFAAAAIAITLLMTMRAPAFRYLFPVALCAMLLMALAADEIRNVRWALLVLAALLFGKALARDVSDHRNRLASQRELHDEVAAIVRRIAPNGVVVYSFRFPQPSFALRINATTDAQLAEIARAFPREGHVSWKQRVVLPPGAAKWDVLVIDEALPQPAGRTVAKVHEFRIVLPP